jgi:hypothetical protein
MKKLFQESLMSKFRAAEALINIFEGSDDDSKCADDLMDDDEIDILEKRLSTESEDDSEDQDNGFKIPYPPLLTSGVNLPRSLTVEMFECNDQEPVVIPGRQNKNKTSQAFTWYSKPDAKYIEKVEFNSRVYEEWENYKEIEYFFKLILTPDLVDEIVMHTNSRINLIDKTEINNEKYRLQIERSMKIEITNIEMYAFIGILILFGIT